MANFTEGDQETDNDEEAMVEIKPDTQSLSQQSTGDSTFERHRRDRQPLIKKGRAWNDDDLRTSAAELELTAGVRQVLLHVCPPPTRQYLSNSQEPPNAYTYPKYNACTQLTLHVGYHYREIMGC